MKILIFTNKDTGLYKFRKELLQQLINDGVHVFIALPDGEYIPLLKKMGCIFCETPVDRRGMNPWKDLRLLIRYNRLIRKIRPDIVLTYTIKPNIYGGIICRLYHVKYIETITGLGTAIEDKGILSKILLLLYKVGLKNASQVFFQNAENQRFFKENKMVKKSRLISGSGVNLQEHCFEEYPTEDGELRFIFIGRIMKDKGIEELLICAEQLKAVYPNIYFDLVGNYDEESYRAQVEELEKKGIVKYLAFQSDVHSVIKRYHAIILPTYHEGLSNVLLEAAACGRPVLTTRIPGCRETYEEEVSGIGFEAKNTKSLIEAVEKFIGLAYEEKREMGIQGRKKMEREFDRQLVIEAYMQEIKGI